MGQLGTTPAVKISGACNAGDIILRLVNAPHDYGIDEAALQARTDGHMDCDAVRAGAILLCPVKVPGAGIYMGDMHAMQGDGEIAGHTTDVSGTVTLQVELIKGLNLEGPILFPVPEDLPFLAQPLSAEECRKAQLLAREWGMTEIELSAPVSVIGTGATLNEATYNGLGRAAKLLDMTAEEVRNRATISGSIEIARLGGVVQVTFLAPLARLDAVGLGKYAREQYGILE
jgi:formamidase